jgi:hypothetical protein
MQTAAETRAALLASTAHPADFSAAATQEPSEAVPEAAAQERGEAWPKAAPQKPRRDRGQPRQPRGPPLSAAADSADLLWGGQKIADFLGLPLSKFYHLNSLNAFGDAVARLSHKTLVASRSELARLPQRCAANHVKAATKRGIADAAEASTATTGSL